MIYPYAVVALVAALLSGFGTWRAQEWRHDANEKARMEAEAEQARERNRAADSAAAGHENFRERERVVYQTITETVDRIVERPIYRNVCLDADGLRQLNAAIAGGVGPGEPAPAVPGPAASR